MPLPILTWSQTAYTSTGQTAPTDAQVIQAINTATANLTKWRKISVESTNWTYIELGGPVGSAVENYRILIGGAPGASAVLAPDTTANAIWFGSAPSGGTLGTWNSATPYGPNRWTKYWRCCATGVAESLYFVESDEVLGLFFRDDSADNFYGFIAGAVFNPGSGDAEASGHVYGHLTSGSTVIGSSYWSSPTTFLNNSLSVGLSHCGVFRPSLPATFENVFRSSIPFVDSSMGLTFNSGLETALPAFYHSNQSPVYFVGSLRQMLISKDRSNKETLPGVGLVFSAKSSPATADTLLFSNA
jgi:hypothetical protein